MGKIFISYSTKNRELAEKFIEFLLLAMGVTRENIFCTALAGTLKMGEPFVEGIRKGMAESQVVIMLITEEYLNSKFCISEAGAAWAMKKKCIPLLLVPFSKLNDTPLLGMQMGRLDDADALSHIYDELMEWGVAKKRDIAEFNKHLNRLMEYISQENRSKNQLQKTNSKEHIRFRVSDSVIAMINEMNSENSYKKNAV